ncbi:GlxA family transcriptional regulator [Streptomyces globisporus]|uniref:GlxA family transcriptional regulator n=1 Tax=Streptomyces albovinaceus subgroup TaxID=1482558 RepID=UPI001ABF7D2E|nr:helix-turn-helix domain-containing protein [Streptomyces albovinaceus]WSQ93177.1 helix-turn-helix domain-containing protein [Streptomyces globisporus]WSU82567.1 helix-turn-helix domain-containing protein [Streptomyces globisporus]WSV91141.1 helix-turn-helix domain-containing protein [Streptomyces globisporus]
MPVSRHHHVVALLNDPQSPFELACAAEVFGVHAELPPHYTFEVCARRPGPLPTTAGYPLLVESGLDALRRADTVVVPGWQPPGGPVPDDVLDALRAAHRRGARTVSICTGAFVLAQAGLLGGRRATTHWRRTGQLAAAFPEVSVAEDVLYVDHGDVATSAGSGAGIDLCLHLVRSDLGSSYAAQVARSMVLPPHRDGSQLQYAPPPTPAGPGTDASLAPVLEWALTRLAADLSVGRLAAYAGLSPRTFARRFVRQVGVSPGQWLLQQRIDAARSLLERTDLPVETVAARVGLSSAVNLRRRFRTAVGTTPGAYRRLFGERRQPDS